MSINKWWHNCHFGWAISLRSKQHRKPAVLVYNGDLSVYRCANGLHHLDLITHLVLVWRSDLPDSPFLSTVNLAAVSRWWIALWNTSVSHRASLLLKEFASLMVVLVHQTWRQLARQMEGEKALLPLLHIISLKRDQMYVSGCYGDLAFSDDSDPSACRLHVDWEREW